MKSENLDQIIDRALSMPPEREMPDTFTERFMQRLEKRIALRDILFDFGLKVIVMVGVLMVLCMVFIFVYWGKEIQDNELVQYLLENIVPIAMLLIGIIFTFIIDQVLLRYFLRRRNLGR